MTRSDSEQQPRPLLLLTFAAVAGLLGYNSFRIWDEVDNSEKWARVGELFLVAVAAWVVVWPASFPSWHSTKRASNGLDEPDRLLQGSRGKPIYCLPRQERAPRNSEEF